MRVEWAFACRTLTLDGTDANVEGVAIDTLALPSLPAELELVVLGRIAAMEAEGGTAHPFECSLTVPDMESVESLHLDLNLGRPGIGHPAGWEVKIFLPMIVRFEARSAGTYGLVVWIDGRFRWQVPFRVLTQ